MNSGRTVEGYEVVEFIPFTLKLGKIAYSAQLMGGFALMDGKMIREMWKPIGLGFYRKTDVAQYYRLGRENNDAIVLRPQDIEQIDELVKEAEGMKAQQMTMLTREGLTQVQVDLLVKEAKEGSEAGTTTGEIRELIEEEGWLP